MRVPLVPNNGRIKIWTHGLIYLAVCWSMFSIFGIFELVEFIRYHDSFPWITLLVTWGTHAILICAALFVRRKELPRRPRFWIEQNILADPRPRSKEPEE